VRWVEGVGGNLVIKYVYFFSTYLLCLKSIIYLNKNFRKNGWSALHIACLSDKPDDVKTLLDGNADTEPRSSIGQTALHVACEKGLTKCVQLLLDKKANIDARDDYGKTPLHYACQFVHFECVKLLIAQKANLTSQNESPQSLAIQSKSLECVQLLWECLPKESSK